MNTAPPHSITQDSVTVVIEGRTFTVRSESPNFNAARTAAFNGEWAKIPGLASPGVAIEQWLGGYFAFQDGFVLYKTERVDTALNERLKTMAAKGDDPSAWLKFWARLQLNPSWRSVNQLYAFLAHRGIAVDEKTGFILAYKSVTREYKDHHTRTVDNSPGTTHEMPRNKISDDPNEACHFGFHVGALAYARSFGSSDKRIIICSIDPADVVCVPHDSSQMKVRVCKYSVVGNYSGTPMSDTVEEDEDLSVDADGDGDADRSSGPGEAEDDGPDGDDEVDEDGEDLDDVIAEGEDEVAARTPKTTKAEAKTTSLQGHDDWAEFNAMSAKQLEKAHLGILRQYARFGLHIFKASKIPGGKPALIKRILEVRRK